MVFAETFLIFFSDWQFRTTSGTARTKSQPQFTRTMADFSTQFKALAAKTVDEQMECFVTRFVFILGEAWKDVAELAKRFKKAVLEAGEGKPDMNLVTAGDFLQKNGIARTALQRKQELQDIDLDNNGRVSFIEFLLLHYKLVILGSYYQRTGGTITEDFSKGGIGVTGVGAKILDELFTYPLGLDASLEAAIADWSSKKQARDGKIVLLHQTAAQGGVKALAAKNELEQMTKMDETEDIKMQITIDNARKKMAKAQEQTSLQQKAEKEAIEKQKVESGRANLKSFASKFEK